MHRVLDIIGSKDLNSKIEFCCKTYNASILPPLDQDSMNSQGSAKILNVLDYIFFEDHLCQHIHGAPTNAEKKSGSNTRGSIDYIELLLIIPPSGPDGKQKEILLHPDLSLGLCRKYLFDLIDIEGKQKSMPLYYRLKE